jgi:Cu+-exporting ATPase
MLTGDRYDSALAVALQVGIPERNVIAGALPHQKAEKVKELEHQLGKVAFIGDGINDSPTLVSASVGISLKEATDIATEVNLGCRAGIFLILYV